MYEKCLMTPPTMVIVHSASKSAVRKSAQLTYSQRRARARKARRLTGTLS